MSESWWEEALKSKPYGKSLIANLEKIREKAEPLLKRIVATFPDYTPHDINHSNAVIEQFNLIIPKSLKEKLNEYEIYFLIASTYLHDIGMVDFPELRNEEELEKFGEKERRCNPDNTNEQILQGYIRENHHLRAEKYIESENNLKDLAIEDEHQAKIIGRICRGHRVETLNDKDLFEYDKTYKRKTINIPLLAALLRIADELDLTFERTPLIVYEHAPPKEPISRGEWEKHLSVSGVDLNPEDPFIINSHATCKNPKVHRALKRLENKINTELDDLPNHLHQHRECIKDLPRKFVIKLEAIGYKPYDFKFSLNERKIVNLLMGERLYERKEESLRELLKNSVDACRRKRELLKEQSGISYTLEIVFELTPDNRLIVTDNGTGMDEGIIERHFAKIGESFYESEEFLEEGLDFTPVSELGIGFLSCFMIADKIVIETKAEDNEPLLVEIGDLSDYFFVMEGERKYTGTTVTLFLKRNDIDLEKEIRFYARHLEFPIKVILQNGEETIIKDAGFKPNEVTLLGEFAKYYSYYLIPVDKEHVEGIVAILFEKDEKLDLKPIENPGDLIEKLDRKEKSKSDMLNKFFVSNEGIFIGDIHIPRSILLFVDLNLKKDVLTLNIARNYVVQNSKLTQFIKPIETTIINNTENFLITLERKAKEANIDFTKLSNNFFGNYAHLLEIADYYSWEINNELGISPPDELNLVKRFYYFKCISKEGFKYLRYDEIKQINKPLIVLKFQHDYYSDEDLKQVFLRCSGFTENYIYLMPGDITTKCANYLFEDVKFVDVLKFFDMESSKELEDVIPEKGFEPTFPKEYQLVRFKNYTTSRLLECLPASYEADGCGYFYNRNNKFIDLLIKNKRIIREDVKSKIKEFFTILTIYIENYLQREFFSKRLLSDQRDILKRFVEGEIIREDEINNYILTREDFPPDFITIDGD